MKDQEKTKKQLIAELAAMRQRNTEFEADKAMRLAENAELLRSKERYRNIVELSPDGIATVNLKGVITSCNRSFLTQSGFAKDKIVGKHFSRIPTLRKKDIPRYTKLLGSITTEKIPEPFEITWTDKEGNLSVAELRVCVMKEHDKPTGVQIMARDIGKRNRVEQALRESEQQLHQIFDTVGIVLFYLAVEPDDRYRFLSVNQLFLDATGLAKDQVIGKRIEEVIPEPSVLMVKDNYKKAIKENRTIRWEETTEFPAGVKVGEVIARPFFDDKGICTHLVGSVHDITERKKVEDIQRLQSEITANMSEGVCLIRTSDMFIVYTNPKFAEMFGYGPDEIIGQHVSIINAPTDLTPKETVKAIMSEIVKMGGAWKGEVENIKKNGTPFWCHDSVTVFDHPEYGEVLVSVHTDITERKRAEARIEESEKLYRGAIEASGAVPYYKSYSTNAFKFIGPGIEPLTGYPKEKFTIKVWRSIIKEISFHGEAAGLSFEEADRKARSGEINTWQADYRIQNRSGEERWISNSSVRVRDDQGRVSGSLGTLVDITERKRMEETLRRSHDVLERKVLERTEELEKTYLEVQEQMAKTTALQEQPILNERLAVLGQLAATIAHEINSPLLGVATLLSGIKKSYGEQEGLGEDLELVSGAFKSIRIIVQRLLDLSRRGDKKRKTPIDANNVIDETAKLMSGHLKKSGVRLSLSLSPKVPRMKGSEQEMVQVFINLINNAVEAMENGPKRGKEIKIRTKLRKGSVVIEVEDTGPGIGEKDMAKIFDPFFTRKKKLGVGVGLSVCYRIISEHGGRIRVRNVSSEGGAKFTITL